jgi:hypothetical protein
VEKKYYKSFINNITGFLLLHGHHIVNENKHGIVFDLNVEKLVIPKKHIGFVQIYFVREGKIVDRFMTISKYKFKAQAKFLKFYKKRMLATLSEIDNL